MNKFKLSGTVTIKDIKHFNKGTYQGKILKFMINYQISGKRSTVFMCSTFNEQIINELKDNDVVELIDYIPTSDKYTNAAGQTSYFNTLIVRELRHVKITPDVFGENEIALAVDNFDVNSFQENYGEDIAMVEEPAAMNKLEMLEQQQEIMNNQPLIETEEEVVLEIQE